MPHKFFEDKRPHNGLPYDEYTKLATELAENPNLDSMDESEKSMLEYTKLNVRRSRLGDKKYKPGEEIKKIVANIKSPQLWMVITEEWCGDSAQNLPYINKLAESNKNIDLRILYRDDNLDIIDEYLTNGTRSIPILVAFDSEGNKLFQWGPRPKEAADLVKQWKSEGQEKTQFIENLHLWYGRNRGKAIDAEFVELLKTVVNNIK